MTPDQFRRMTPAEFFAMAEGRIAAAKQARDEHDILNALQCLITAKCAGNKNATLEQFMIFRENEKMTPDQIMQVMDHLAAEDHHV